jgi:predicted metal-dependent peptidase
MSRILADLRSIAGHKCPYMATTLFALPMIEKPGIGTFAIDDRGTLYLDPKLIGSTWTLEQAAWVLVHEIWHWALGHAGRAKYVAAREGDAYDAKQSNIAADLEINGGMKAAGANLPPEGAFPENYKLPNHLPFEQYYDLLKQQGKKQQKQGQSRQGNYGKGPESQGEGSGQGSEGCTQGQGQGGHGKPGESWDCGSGAHGQKRPWEDGSETDGAGGKAGEKDAPRGLTDTENDMLRDSLANAVKSASKTRGDMPTFAKRWADDRLAPPKVPWEQELRAKLSQAVVMASGASDYTWQRPSRRGNPTGVIMPRLVRPQPEVCAIVDTSGSMSDDMLKGVLAEVQGIINALGQHELPVICCDSAASKVQRVTSALDVKLVGGGGTDMRVGVKAAREQLPAHRIIVILTDGYTPWPDEISDVEFVAGLIGGFDAKSVPSHIHTVVID